MMPNSDHVIFYLKTAKRSIEDETNARCDHIQYQI